MSSQRADLFPCLPPPSGTVSVNGPVCFGTGDGRRVIPVRGVVFAHYCAADRAAEAFEMATLWESGYAAQTQPAHASGYSARSLRRCRERFAAEGLRALPRQPGRPAGRPTAPARWRERGQAILHLSAKGAGHRVIAGRLGLPERAIRKRLRRLGWQP